MKVSKAQASQNKAAIVEVAAEQIRKSGLDHISVAEVAQAAGLTHGAIYSHFGSKEALKAEAMTFAFDECIAAFGAMQPEEFLATYLSTEHRDNPEKGCPTSATVSEVRWQPDQFKVAFRAGFEAFARVAEDNLGLTGTENARERAVFMFSAMMGGLAVSRAIKDVDEKGSVAVLSSVADQLRQLMPGPLSPAASSTRSGRKSRSKVAKA